VIIDGINVNTFDVIVENRSSSRSAATVKQLIEGAPGAWRRKRLGRAAPGPGRIQVTGHVLGDTLALLRSNIDQFKWTTRADKELVIRWSDTSDREWFGFRQDLRINDIIPGWVTDGVRFNLVILLPDPAAKELTTQSPSTSGAAPLVITPVIGTAPNPVKITITGNTIANLVNPVIHYRDKNNGDIVTLAFTGTLTGANTLVLDTEFFSAKLDGADVGGSMAGSYFDVNPNDGDYLGSPAGPDIQLTADSGTADNFQLDFKRRYW